MNNGWWTKLWCVLAVLAGLALPRAASAQSVAYLNVENLPGDVTGAPFAGQHVVESFSFAELIPSSSSTRPVAQPVKLRLQVSTAGVDFLRALETNLVLKTATLSFAKAGERAPFVYQDIVFESVRVVGYRMAWADGAARPSLEVELTYQSARWRAFSQANTGLPGPSNSYLSSTPAMR